VQRIGFIAADIERERGEREKAMREQLAKKTRCHGKASQGVEGTARSAFTLQQK